MSQIHIIGLDHFLQSQHSCCLTAAGLESERQQKQQFEAMLRGLIRDAGIELIAEEGTFDCTCLGCRLAQEIGLKYVIITMPQAERDRIGIPNNYEDREEDKRMAFEAFEAYMAQKVNEQGSAGSILVLCGRLHLGPLRDALLARGYDVQTMDISEYEWFRGRPIEGEAGVIGYHREP